MNDNLPELLNALPEKPPQSKLEPHRALIFELRSKGWTYRDMAALFAEKLKISVAPSTLHNFVKVRSRRRNRGGFLSMNEKSEGRLSVTEKRTPRRFEFTPGETLELEKKK